MPRVRTWMPSWLIAPLLVACSEPAGPRFVDGDASVAADTPAAACTASTQCDDGVACTRDICVVGGVCEHVPDGPMCMPAMRCTRAADCNDNVACTRDTCLVDGTCGHTVQNDMCPAGQTCDTTRGCSSGATPGMCRTEADCRDAFDCTVDTCGADGRCASIAQNARCSAGQVCRVGMGCISERSCSADTDCDDRMRCNGAERCVEFGCVAGTAVNCDDMDPCTTDTCAESGASMCAHAMVASCMGGGNPRSGVYSLNPGVMYTCDSLLGTRVVEINMSAVQITVTATGITVTGAPATMTGGPVMSGMFSASGTIAGTCAEVYTLTGRFTDDRHFSGTFGTMYTGLDCFFTNCVTNMFPVMGTLAL